ncbi:MAG: hypothetical protein K6B74_13120, partial [Ruminococcus sp.]|nr:hypothetical protein [Ruminococcus sp.]
TVSFDYGENITLMPMLHSDEQTYSGTVPHEQIKAISSENNRLTITLPRFSGEMFKIDKR